LQLAQDPEGFIAEGGWDFLDAEADSEAEGEDEGAPAASAGAVGLDGKGFFHDMLLMDSPDLCSF
jgi:hypothetical protein